MQSAVEYLKGRGLEVTENDGLLTIHDSQMEFSVKQSEKSKCWDISHGRESFLLGYTLNDSAEAIKSFISKTVDKKDVAIKF